ncbi:FTR1 family protein [Noviherbaspirillum saxi]|uniref:Iron permease n=1 Tax=Noviherbaspirillum saxi TaxID=2320863 RepID=A0A3A3FJM6_9BURK|nr:iron permease [Noviherbaspirillum saxi]
MALLLPLISFTAPASSMEKVTEEKAKQIWQMLDYLAVDYAGAVKDGKIANDAEYAEMQEFSQNAEQQIRELPNTTATAQLIQEAARLRKIIADKAAPVLVAEHARNLASTLLAAYPVPVAPGKMPELQHGARLYQAQCAACHGQAGHADGPLAAKLEPPPIAFADHDRAKERSIFSLYQTTTRGVEGTAMASFGTLSEDDRWAVAFFASTLAYSDSDRQLGAKLWSSDKSLHAVIAELGILTQTAEASLTKRLGPENARAVLAYLRSHPEILNASKADGLALSKSKLRESLLMLEKGDKADASRLAISAYLDGFEPVEPALAAKNKVLFEEIEKTMGTYRAALSEAQLETARSTEKHLQALLTDAQATLGAADSADPLATFIGALTILLREGLEALLIVVAMIAFLRRAERSDVLPYVHAGWVSALAAGGLTWAVATYLIDLSGASREMTEGFSAIFAAVMLLTVGIWMHQKSLAGRWQAYVKEKLSHALNKRSATVLFVLSFVTVYREVFETVLFYAALWNDGNGLYLLGGLTAGVVILSVIAAILLRTTARLPISQFFAVSSALVAVLAIVLIGKGVAALQEAGMLDVTPISVPRIDLLGIYPSQQTLIAQAIVLFVVIISFGFNLRPPKKKNI